MSHGPQPAARGRFVTLEGGEGAGKSTLARALAAALAAAGQPALRTREPGGSPGAEAIRGLMLGRDGWDPLAEAMLVTAARREHLVHTIRPALEAGIWVVSDRFADSTLAYQGLAQGLGEAPCRALAELALDGLRPDLTLVLDVEPGLGTARALGRGDANRFDARDAAFHARIRRAFLDIAAAEPGRCLVLDAARPPEAVLASALAALRERLPGPA
ncbi:dTMP kinase [Roseomonas sp. OT10]|uniref:dTMP kinase n=1 Tax=Roseomonas cutis TaxID=2897332 RepID=UPI001E503095|nr:dTMP kinase [Roseomonas sp. OT10]UFN50694.1 dTMP kinase [Roseomonas sp. OT10]